MDLYQAGLGSVYGRPREVFPAICIDTCEWMLYSIQLRESRIFTECGCVSKWGCDCLPHACNCGQLTLLFISRLPFSYTGAEYWLSALCCGRCFVCLSAVCSEGQPVWETHGAPCPALSDLRATGAVWGERQVTSSSDELVCGERIRVSMCAPLLLKKGGRGARGESHSRSIGLWGLLFYGNNADGHLKTQWGFYLSKMPSSP